MSLLVPALSAFYFTYDNWGANPSANIGTSVIPGASNVEGSWTQIASSANIAQDCYWIELRVFLGATSAQAKNHLLDIGVDPAGGSSYTAIISNLQVGASASISQAGIREFVFPFFIKASSSVAVRIQGSNGTAGTVRVAAKFFGQPSNPAVCPVGAISQTFGTITNSNGQSFTPGNVADGSWADLGSLSQPLWWWQMGHGIDNSVLTVEYTYIEVAYGDGSNKDTIFKVMHAGTNGETIGLGMQSHLLACAAYKPVPAGANIYIRGRCDSAPDASYHATVIGIGG